MKQLKEENAMHDGRQRGWMLVVVVVSSIVSACGMAGSPTASATATVLPAAPPRHSPATEVVIMELITAAERGDGDAVQRLLAQGIPMDAQDSRSRTALIAAAYRNHVAVAELLITAGADVNIQDDTQQSTYLIATSEVGDDSRLLNLTLQHGADVHSLDSYHGTGLIRAAERGHVAIIRELLNTDIRVDHVNRLGWTALLEAIILGDGGTQHTEVVRLLVDADADVQLADRDGVTPLGHARQRGYAKIVALLERAGAR